MRSTAANCNPPSRGARRHIVAGVVLLVVVALALPVGAAPPSAPPAQATAAIDKVAATLGGLSDSPITAVPTPAGTLTTEIVGLSSLLGVPLDAADVDAQVSSANLSPATQTSLAQLLAHLSVCTAATNAALQVTSIAELWSGAASIPPAQQGALRTCAVALQNQTHEVTAQLAAAEPDEGELRIWPVLAYSPGEDHRDVYREDFALVVDRGGNDWYRNNQGSNALDLKRSLTSPAAREQRAARGCHHVFPEFSSGRFKRGPNNKRQPSFDGPECHAAAALLLDLGGNDRYGSYETPTFPDDLCTPDKIVRRISTIGVGVAGVGMLVDMAGDDLYLGKTGTQGAGHLGGIGVLDDFGGDDRYVAVRGAQGTGLLDGIGVLRDRGGDDVYTFRMPRPLDPSQPNNRDGSGGVTDDTGLGSELGLGQHETNGVGGTCDRLERSVQGVGLLAGVGLLVEDGGDDRYRGTPYLNQPFFKVAGAPVLHFAHGSQGSGFLGGTGGLLDLGGLDRYTRPNGRPSPARGNGRLAGPRLDPTLEPEGPGNGKSIDVSVFYDSGP